MKKGSLTGIVLVIIGLALLISKYIFGMELIHFQAGDFWPIIVLGVGVVFELIYYTTLKAPGLLVPGGILTTTGLLFLFEVATDWRFAAYTWPVYIFAVAVGLFQLYMHIGRPKGLLIAASIVGIIALLSFVMVIFEAFVSFIDVSVIIPIVLILGGLFFVFRRKSTNSGSW